MDPLDCTLDELANNTKKRRRNHHNHSNYNPNNPSQKRFKHNNYNNNNNNNSNYNYNNNRNRNYNYNNRNRNRNRSNYHQNHNRIRYNSNTNSNYYIPRNQNNFHSLPQPPTNNYYITTPQSETKTETDSTIEPKYGYVTLIMRGDNYIPGALILAHSLRLVNTKHSLIAMITNDISIKAKKALNLLYDFVIEVPYIKYKCKPMKTEKQKEKYNAWATDSFTKWNILQLNKLLNINFNKLLFLDSDKIVIKNIDTLFTDNTIQTCPAGTFSSPWTNKKSNKGLIDYYPKDIKHGDIIPAMSIYNALYKNGFVAVGTGMLFQPNIKHYEKFIKMLNNKWICNEYMDNDIDKEKIKLRRINNKFAVNNEQKNNEKIECKEENSDRLIGFSNCYSMLDEQSIVFFYYYHRMSWSYIDTKYNFIPWHFKWLENSNGLLDIPMVLHFFGMKPWNLSPLEWKDLQVWWGLVFNLVNYACDDRYEWNNENKQIISEFFRLDLINQLPLGLFIENENENENNGKDFEIEKQNDNNNKVIDKELKSKVVCFWCYEIAKRQKLDPIELIKQNDFDKIDWIFHCPIDPLTGKLCCKKLLADKSEY